MRDTGFLDHRRRWGSRRGPTTTTATTTAGGEDQRPERHAIGGQAGRCPINPASGLSGNLPVNLTVNLTCIIYVGSPHALFRPALRLALRPAVRPGGP